MKFKLFLGSVILTGLFCATGRAAGINYAGVQTDLGSGWRTSSVQKPLDIDGDNVLGTDGYYMVNLPAVLPDYVSQAAILTSTSPGDPSYAFIDDPTRPGNLFETGTMNPVPGPGTSANLFSFTVNSAVAGRWIRIGLMVDNLDSASFNATSLEVVRTNGAGGSSGSIATTSTILNDRVPDWLFFDIPASAAGDTFIISGVGGAGGTATLGGVAFDSVSTLVTTTNDSGAGSLRATAGTAPNGSTITFSTNMSGQTITLTSGPVILSNTVTFDATALSGGLTLSGGGSNQIFTTSFGASNTLLGLTFSGGHASDAGGAIYSTNGSFLQITGCTFTSNNALEGGAILNDGVLQVVNSTFAGNYGSFGGALQCRAPATLIQCTISANNSYASGGIYNKGSTLTVNNSIIAGNTTTVDLPDIYSQNAALELTNANLIQGIGQDANSPPVSGPAPITNAPLLEPLGNYGGPTQTMLPLPDSPVIDAGGSTTLATDQRGYARVVGAAPDLGAVEFQDASPVVCNSADSGVGSLRFAATYTTNGQVITFAPDLDGDTILLTGGLLQVNLNLTIDGSALPDGIVIDGNQNGQVFNVGSNSISIFNDLTIAGGSSSYGGAIGNSGTLTLNECTVAGSTAYAGGAIYNSGNTTLTLNQCTVTGNTALDSGGGVFNYAGTLNVNQCTVTGNSAGSNYYGGGGGINNYAGSMTLANTIVAGNTGPYYSNLFGSFGGSYNLASGDPLLAPLDYYGGPTPTMQPLPNSPAIDGCTGGTSFATDQRGFQRIVGPFADIGAVEYEACPVVTTTADGGVGSLRYIIDYSADEAVITFAKNLSGATIPLTGGLLQLNQSVAIDASTLPGGVVIDGNHSSQVFNVGPNSITILNDLTIANGSSSYGGAIGGGGTLFLNNCTVTGSTAFLGGALYMSGGTATLNQCTFTGNSAADSGGALFNYVGTLNVNQCTVAGNSAGSNYFAGGGGVNNYDGAMTLNNTIVAGNTNFYYSDLFGSFTGGDNLTNGNPLLAPPGNYGGTTPTMPPLPGSPAIDGCVDGTSFATDQRGYPRIDGAFADIGSVEGVYNSAGPGTLTTMVDLPDSSLTISFTNYSDMTFTVLTSTNVALPLHLWHKAGFAEETFTGSGQYQFYDSVNASHPQRFYIVRSP
jgi:fibronectin-binding autotransporter adhesin